MMQKSIDLIGKDEYIVLASQLDQLALFRTSHRIPGWIVRAVDNDTLDLK
jgi:hypothetical protein